MNAIPRTKEGAHAAPLPFYRDQGGERALVRAAHAARLPLLLKGPTGTGKTRLVERMAAELGLPLFTVACHDDLSAADLIGRFLLRGGETVWQDGPLTRAVREGGICYLDEVVEARRDVAVVLHPLTDHRRRLVIDRTGEELTAPPSFMLVASFNPGYQSVLKKLKPSTRQRFAAIELGFPDEAAEAEVIAAEAGLEPDRARALARLGARVRALSGMDLEEGVSTRLLIYAGALMAGGMRVHDALEAAVIEPLTDEPEVRESLRDLAAAVWG
jgi:nitric oxide reductase NorQ protein